MLHAGWEPIPGHRLVRSLGTGSFGEVWEAVREDGQRFALKFLDCRAGPASVVASEVRMLRSLTALQHPHIVPLHGVHACGRYLILILERADGNLADLLATYLEHANKNIPPDHALELLEQAALALDFMATSKHPALPSGGLQHCDVKPSNLLIFGDTLKVGDFGLCSGAGWQTHQGGWKGTIPYAAPELFGGAAVPGTDQYALAVTFCEVVVGERAFIKGATPGNSPIDLTRLREQEFAIIARALHPYPSSRWPSCTAFIQALRKVALGKRGERRSRVLPRAGAGANRSAMLRKVIQPIRGSSHGAW